MSSRVPQRTVYLVTAAIVVAMVGGFALAQISTGGVNTSYQGSQTTTVSAVQGLSYVSTDLIELGATVVPTTCSQGSPCSVTTVGAIDCAGGFTGSTGCAATDYVEQVTITTDAGVAFVGTVTLTLYVSGTPVGGSYATFTGTSFYYTQVSTGNSAQDIVIDFDTGTATSGPGAVATVSVIALD